METVNLCGENLTEGGEGIKLRLKYVWSANVYPVVPSTKETSYINGMSEKGMA